jgi:protein-disulfide isomerase
MRLGTPTYLDAGAIPAGATPDGDGILLGDGPVLVDAYVDFLCPFCRQFEEASGEALDAMLDDHAIRLAYHPLGFLDRLSTTRYSSRAAAASGCAADAGAFRPYAQALFANQPPEGGPGLSDTELIELGRAVGLTDPGFARGVTSGVHLPWVTYVTERAIERGVSGTPSVFVAGVPVPANARTIAAAVAAAMR